jgi:hypothetical protein
VLPNPVPGAAEARVREYLNMGGLTSDSSVGVAVTPASTSMGTAAPAPGSQVTVTYPFSFIMLQPVAQLLVNGSLVGSPITVTATSIMRNETGS